jgi:hypothetical protein
MEIAAMDGHLDVVQYLAGNMKQRAFAWGMGAAARQGWLKTLQARMQHYHNYNDVGFVCCGLVAFGKAFDKMMTQLSY